MEVWYHNENPYPFVPQDVLDRADSVPAFDAETQALQCGFAAIDWRRLACSRTVLLTCRPPRLPPTIP